ncbi:hypothetical protein, partial [Enterobacter hormaechei]|uniref:hypothetical protein n=1 Tax=Enterobacter hormaechei TaxID=158836 RepID=UPI00195441D3
LGGFGISRYTLDHALANKAIELGVELKMGEKVKGVSDKGEGIGNKVEGVSNKQKEGGERQVVETDKTKVAAR